MRQVQVAASWSAQILLYPLYALFQTSRLVGQTIGRTVEQHSPSLPHRDEEPYEIPLKGTASELTAETPVQNVLKTVQTLALASDVPVLVLEEVSIRAIASLIDTKALVLVTNHNQVLDVLTLEQQHLLNQRIVYEVAVLGRQVRSWKLPLQRAQRFLQSAGKWVQSRVATVLSPAVSNSSNPPLLAPDVDMPVKQCLLAVREVMPATQTSVFLPAATVHSTPLATSQPQSPTPAVYIRGVASLLATQSLVLVTNQNESLDILTPEQQRLLHQRIAWEVAHYLRYVRSRLCQTPGLSPLRPPNRHSFVLPPVRAFQWLMAWMQSGAIAASANLFQEASWRACPLPFPPAKPALPASNLAQRSVKALRQQVATARARLPGRLANPTRVLPASAQPTATLVTSAQARGSAIRPSQTRQETAVERVTSPSSTIASHAIEELAVSTTSDRPERSPDYIDTHVTLMGYEQTWLERIVHWLDICLLWLEERISAIWRALTQRP